MPNFESSISGNKKFLGTPMRELDIPNETGDSESQQFTPSVTKRYNLPEPQQYNIPSYQDLQHFHKEESVKQLENEMRAAKEAKKLQINRLSEGAKKRIEMLVGMTSYSREFEIEGYKYVLHTIQSQNYRDAVVAITKYDGTIQLPFESRRQLLARSLYKIADINFEDFIGSNDVEDKLNFIDQLHDGILDRLFAEYKIMMSEYKEKYTIKNTEDAKEVVEDLKK